MTGAAEKRGRTHAFPLGTVLVVSVPVVLASVHTLPVGVRRGLALDLAAPTPVSFYTAHFVHFGIEHLVSNLLFYVLATPITYLLARATDELRTFRRAFLTVLVVFPPALSGLTVALGRPALGYGFSGLNLALFGISTLLLGRFLSRRFDLVVDDRGLSIFGVGVAVVALRALPSNVVTYLIAFGAGCLSLAVALERYWDRGSSGADPPPARRGDAELAVVATVVCSLLPFVAFAPATTVAAGLGLYVHFLGYALSYTVLYVADVLGLLA